jgi:hypothetical protein
MVECIPRWAKEDVELRGCVASISIGSTVRIVVTPLSGDASPMSRRFAPRTYEESPDDCWRELLSQFAEVYRVN